MRRLALGLVVVLAAAACSGSSKAATPSASVTAPPTTAHTTTTATVEQQVEAAYLHSWDVYAKASQTLDPSVLSEAYASPQLEVTTREIERRKSANQPARISVEHHITTQVVDSATAVVRDAYVNHSVILDPATGAPAEPDPNKTLSDTYTMKLIEGRWMVTAIVRQR